MRQVALWRYDARGDINARSSRSTERGERS